MGDAKRRLTRNERLREQQPFCIYCGGNTPSESVDHAPPISIFDLRDRPAGLEFGCCRECHDATRPIDAVASVMSRMYPDPVGERHRNELRLYVGNFIKRFPSLAAELMDSAPYDDGRISGFSIRGNGSGLTAVMEHFSARMTMALHYATTGSIVGHDAIVLVDWYTNADAIQNKLPRDFIATLGPTRSLVAGRKQMFDQFAYNSVATSDGTIFGYYATFRASFGFAGFVSFDDEHLAKNGSQGWFKPGFLKAYRVDGDRQT